MEAVAEVAEVSGGRKSSSLSCFGGPKHQSVSHSPPGTRGRGERTGPPSLIGGADNAGRDTGGHA